MAIQIANLADIVRIHVARQPAAAAVVYEGRTTTYRALDRAASQVANALIAEACALRRGWRISTSRATFSSR
jgi:long-chain acyl-CoA synthetase